MHACAVDADKIAHTIVTAYTNVVEWPCTRLRPKLKSTSIRSLNSIQRSNATNFQRITGNRHTEDTSYITCQQSVSQAAGRDRHHTVLRGGRLSGRVGIGIIPCSGADVCPAGWGSASYLAPERTSARPIRCGPLAWRRRCCRGCWRRRWRVGTADRGVTRSPEACERVRTGHPRTGPAKYRRKQDSMSLQPG